MACWRAGATSDDGPFAASLPPALLPSAPIKLHGAGKGALGIVGVLQPVQGGAEEAVRRCKLRPQVGRGAKVVKGAGGLVEREVHQAEVEGDHPLERRKVGSPLQARHGLVVGRTGQGEGRGNGRGWVAEGETEGAAATSVGERLRRPGLQRLTATYFFLPKKHMPMLFHSSADSGVRTVRWWRAATGKR